MTIGCALEALGHAALRTEMVAPALVATTVPAGTHRVIFRYRGWQNYLLVFAVGAAALLGLAYTDIRRARSPTVAADIDPGEPERSTRTPAGADDRD